MIWRGIDNGWYKLAEINGLTADSVLVEGTSLVIPAGVIRNTNNVATFTPYDPADIVGNVSPNAPRAAPNKKHGCGGLGQLLLAVVAIAVTMMTSGAMAAAMGVGDGTVGGGLLGLATGQAGLGVAATAGAVGGVAGSVASQAVGVATGIQDKFSWSAVALAAVGGGVGGALASSISPLSGGGAWMGAARAAVGSAVTQGIVVATGLQKEFSWAGVAGAALGAGLTNGMRGEDFGSSLARNTTSALADAAARSLIDGTDFGDNVIAALPDVIGQTIGGAIAGGLGRGTAVGSAAFRLPDDALEVDAAFMHEGGDYATWASSEEAQALGWKTGFDDLSGLQAGSLGTFMDTSPALSGDLDWGGLTFTLDAGRSSAITSQWILGPGASGAMRVISNGSSSYLYAGGTDRTRFSDFGLTITQDLPYDEDVVVRASRPVGQATGIAAEHQRFEAAMVSADSEGRQLAGNWLMDNMPITAEFRAAERAWRNPSVENMAMVGLSLLPMASTGMRALGSSLRGAHVVGEVAEAARGERALSEVDDAVRMPGTRNGCFVAGTLVHTRDGLKPIESIRIGDMVLSRPERDGETGWRRVNDVFQFDDKTIWEVAVATADGRKENFRATGNHPFWVEGIGWTGVEYLERGQTLRLGDDSAAHVAYVESIRESAPVFNFEVDGWHTYHVGQLGVWVHNADCYAETPDGPMSYREIMDAAHANAELVLGEVPEGLHLHHISPLRGKANLANRAEVEQMVSIQHAVLERAGINWATDARNLVHARIGNGVHSIPAMRDLTWDLYRARHDGVDEIASVLARHGRIAAGK